MWRNVRIGEAWMKFFHTDHKHRPDIQYSGSIKLD